MRVDVAIMTALPEERDAVCNALTETCESYSAYEGQKGRRYDVFTLPVSSSEGDDARSIRVAVPIISSAGPINAAIAASRLLVDLSPTLTMLVGIAGCMKPPGPTRALGDIAIGDDIFDYVLRKEQGGAVLQQVKTFNCDRVLVKEINQWKGESTWFDYVKERRPAGPEHQPRAEIGAFASGHTVQADPAKRDELKRQIPNRELIAVEMEAAGIKAVLDEDEHNSFLVIKAYSDWAGDDKAEGHHDKDKWHSYACHTAAVFAVRVLLDCLGSRLPKFKTLPDPARLFDRTAKSSLDCFVESFPNAPPFFGSAARAIFEAGIGEIIDMANMVTLNLSEPRRDLPMFRAKIGRGHQFLIRAREVFGTATEILAFSVDQVSTFWRSPEMKEAVKDYIEHQTENNNLKVMRVFVFSTPEEAHRYARRLDFHAGLYPNTFVCSKEHYEMVLRKELTNDETAIATWLGRDFAILDYGDAGSVGNASYFGDLEGEDLALRPIRRDIVDGINIPHVRRFFNKCALICDVPGEIREVNGIPILRWRPLLSDNHAVWSALLARMFEARTAEVFHITGFTAEDGRVDKDFRRALARMKNDIASGGLGRKSLALKHKVKALGMTRRIDYGEGRPRESITHGRLRYAGDGLPRDVVIMRIADPESLRGFLRDAEHTALRLELFIELAEGKPELKRLLEANSIETCDDLRRLAQTSEALYEALEEAAGLWRVDLQNDEMLEELVEADPPGF
jgi:nucleoside phosphorylase